MGIKVVDILLDNQYATYSPGQKLNGKIEYTLDSPKHIRGICVKFRGQALTTFVKTEELGCRLGSPEMYFGKEEYFKSSYYVIGSESGEVMEIPAGKHVYPFSCQLPLNLPSSFEGELGSVRYTVKVTIDRLWKFDQDTKKAFTVVSDIDLNSSLEYRRPVHLQIDKSLRCCFYRSGNLSVDVRIPVQGFCPGQSIPLDVTCENNTTTALNDIKIILRKIVSYRSQTPKAYTEEFRKDLTDLSLGKVMPGTSLKWQPYFEVPPHVQSNLLYCSIIDVGYEIKIVCYPKGCHRNIKESVPIYLGTVPLVGFQPQVSGDAPSPENQYNANNSLPLPQTSYPISNSSSAPSAPQAETYYPVYPNQYGMAPLYDSFAQPSYRESQFTATSICDPEDDANMRIHGRPDVTPRYLTYGFAIPPK